MSVALSVPFSEYAPTPEDPNKFFDTIAAADEAGTYPKTYTACTQCSAYRAYVFAERIYS